MPLKSNNRIIQPKQAQASSRKTPGAPPAYRPQPTPRVLQTKKATVRATQVVPANKLAPNKPPVVQAHAAKTPCACGGGCCKSKAFKEKQLTNRPSGFTVQRSSTISPTVQLSVVIGGKRKNAPRSVTPSYMKKMTHRQQLSAFGNDASVSVKKRKGVCGFGRAPAAPNWQTRLWNGFSRPGWTHAARAILIPGVTMCAWPGCAALAAHRDHIVPFKRHIHEHADLVTACDGVCHYLGVSRADARHWANDLANLRPLCAHHNGVKAVLDLFDAANIPYPPDCVGECPTGACPACGADICL